MLESVAGSLIAAVIVVVAGAAFSRTARRVLTAAASELLGIDVKYVFSNGKAAESVISHELANASEVRIFAGRGNDFQGTLYAPLLDPASRSTKRVRVLLPNPYKHLRVRTTDWIVERDAELARVDVSYGRGQLRRQIETTIEHVEHHVDGDHFQVRLFELPHVGRIILTDRFAFFTPYSDAKHGRDCRVFQYGRGDIYDNLARFFEMAWKDSIELRDARQSPEASS